MTTILLTGANRGIGLAMTRFLAARGDTVIATARTPGKAAELATLATTTGRVEIHALDVTDEAACARVAAALGPRVIDVLIVNAGVMGSRGGIADPGHDAAEWQHVMATNVAGAYFTARAFLPHVARAKTGRIAFLSSMMGSSSTASGTALAYRASKAAVANLGRNLSVDLKPKGIAVGIYHPGWVSTDMGGAAAPVTPADSAAGLIARIDRLSLATTGVFEDYRGQPYAF